MLRLLEPAPLRPFVLGALVLALATQTLADPAHHGLGTEPHGVALRAAPPLPDPADLPIQLVLDDGGAEAVFGFAGADSRQFLWLNRFANPGPFTLTEIWALFPAGQDVTVGDGVELVVYLDPDGDPATGAQLLASYDETVQATDGATFSVYTLSPGLLVNGAGDVLIGAVNRYYLTGVDPPGTMPAALDVTASQNRSYFALWTGDPPAAPDLATADEVDLLDGMISGNFAIRGFGRSAPAVAIPALGATGLAFLAALVALAGIAAMRRSPN